MSRYIGRSVDQSCLDLSFSDGKALKKYSLETFCMAYARFAIFTIKIDDSIVWVFISKCFQARLKWREWASLLRYPGGYSHKGT